MFFQKLPEGVTEELRDTRTHDPAVELQKALRRKDLRFLGVAGYGLSVPGVPNGGINPVVKIRGVRILSGTGDVVRSDEQHLLQPFANKYAGRYNSLLFAHLLRTNDPAVLDARRLIDKELLRLEKRDPVADAKAEVKSPPLGLIEIWDETGKKGLVPGIDPKVLDAANAADRENDLSRVMSYLGWPFIFIPQIMTAQQHRRFSRQVQRYIIPYNRAVFAHFEEALKKESERSARLLKR